jgi:N-acylglucosamine 2-epimerase
MIFSLVFHELGHFLNRSDIIEAGLFHAREVMEVYRRPDQKLLYEYTYLDGSLINSPQGRVIVPGHAIESMWFMLHIFRQMGDEAQIQQAVETIRWHLELGWDETYGGIFHACDGAGGRPWWRFAEAKLWWPQTEALYALLLAYEMSQERWCLDWFERVHNYAFSHYPVVPYGEWTQRLDRYGRKFSETVALPVKDPFHLPRALIHCIQVLQRLVRFC